MKKFAFISRHTPTPEQIELADRLNIELVTVGDKDAFSLSGEQWDGMDGACVVHPAAALRLIREGFDILVYENANRAPEGEKPQFYASAAHLFRVDSNGVIRPTGWPSLQNALPKGTGD